MPIALNYDPTGHLLLQLPQGPADDGYKLELFVYIIDNDNGLTKFTLTVRVTVYPNNDLTNNLTKEILAGDQQSNVWKIITGGSLQSFSQNVQSFASMTNTGREPIPSNSTKDVTRSFVQSQSFN